MRKKVGVDTIRRDNVEIKENHEIPQTAIDIKTALDNTLESSAVPLNGNHEESADENSDEAEREEAGNEDHINQNNQEPEQ